MKPDKNGGHVLNHPIHEYFLLKTILGPIRDHRSDDSERNPVVGTLDETSGDEARL